MLILVLNIWNTDDNSEKEVWAQSEIGIEKGDAPPNFTLSTLDGKSINLSDLKGKKVVLNFWATWCSPCKAEMPHMQNYYEENQDEQNVEILAVNLTKQDRGLKALQEFVEEYELTFPVLLDETGQVGEEYKVLAIPTTYFISTNGIIYEKRIGPMNEEMLEAIVEEMS